MLDKSTIERLSKLEQNYRSLIQVVYKWSLTTDTIYTYRIKELDWFRGFINNKTPEEMTENG